ncbi:MAG: metallophosphoesterase [Myxococcota bacterium]
MSEPLDANYILFSDVHLGADLVHHVRPQLRERLARPSALDRELAAMLDWYRAHRDPARPWCLVIAGDLVDFIGMAIAPLPDQPLETALNDEERMHGLGSACDHAVWKMRAVAERHPQVFDGLARFVAEGHHLVLVRGNHDIDFHWEAAQAAFVEALIDRLPSQAADAETQERFCSRIQFCPWFYYVEGLLYVEHGHQFDAVCNYPHLLAPLRAADPTRLHWSLSDWLLRGVARPTPGLGSEGHDERGPLDYFRFAWSLGLLGAVRLGYRYARALVWAARSGRQMLGASARVLRDENERAMEKLAKATRVRVERLRALADLWPRPVSSGWLGVLRNTFLDRLGALAGVLSLLFLLMAIGVPPAWLAAVGAGLGLGAAGFIAWSVRQRMREVNPVQSLRQAARRISELFPARYVVMGHTHVPILERIGKAATYVNLGNWGQDDLDGPVSHPAPRTHLVLRWVDGEPQAQLLRWSSERGPVPF